MRFLACRICHCRRSRLTSNALGVQSRTRWQCAIRSGRSRSNSSVHASRSVGRGEAIVNPGGLWPLHSPRQPGAVRAESQRCSRGLLRGRDITGSGGFHRGAEPSPCPRARTVPPGAHFGRPGTWRVDWATRREETPGSVVHRSGWGWGVAVVRWYTVPHGMASARPAEPAAATPAASTAA